MGKTSFFIGLPSTCSLSETVMEIRRNKKVVWEGGGGGSSEG